MNKYGKAAILAVECFIDGVANSPNKAWDLAVANQFPDSPTMQNKGCPRGAFLGLCEEGLIRGIPTGSYTRSLDNKAYAIQAVEILRTHQKTGWTVMELWSLVMRGKRKKHNEQMDVVLSLWEAGFIQREQH